MTAYGRGEIREGDTQFISEIRSVNNRHRDIVVRIPKALQPLEDPIRTLVISRVRRGRVEVSIQMEKGGDAPAFELELNEPLVDAYMDIARRLADRWSMEPELRLDTLFQMKDVISLKPQTVDLDQARSGVCRSLSIGLDSLDEMRIREGDAMEDDFIKRLNRFSRYVDQIHDRIPVVMEAYRKRLEGNMEKMLNGMSADEARLAQEVAVYADRSDITEEMVRLRSHIQQFETYLGVDDAVGRRLDFLIQEMNREVNTLSAKGSDAVISRMGVEMKAELEKLREQVQNVE